MIFGWKTTTHDTRSGIRMGDVSTTIQPLVLTSENCILPLVS